jgi:anti-anti-sigma regulatory factor
VDDQRLTVFPLPGRAGLRVVGEVGLMTRAEWVRALERAVREGEGMREGEQVLYRLELSALTFVDVAGADALVATAQALREGGRIVLHRPPPALSRLLELFWPDLRAIEVSPS